MQKPLYATMRLEVVNANRLWPCVIKNPRQWSSAWSLGDECFYLLTPLTVYWFYHRCRQMAKTDPPDYKILAPRFRYLYKVASTNWSDEEREEFQEMKASGRKPLAPRKPVIRSPFDDLALPPAVPAAPSEWPNIPDPYAERDPHISRLPALLTWFAKWQYPAQYKRIALQRALLHWHDWFTPAECKSLHKLIAAQPIGQGKIALLARLELIKAAAARLGVE